MTKSTKIITSIGSALVIGGGIALAVLSSSNATKDSTWSIYKKNSDSTFAQIKRQKYGNTTIQNSLLKQLLASRVLDSTAIANGDYSSPVVTPPDTGYHRPKYKASGALTFNNQSNITISLDSINSGLGNVKQMVFNNCNNVHLTKCYFTNTTGYAVTFNNCNNVLMDSCFMGKVAFGVNVVNGTNIKILSNQGLNRYDVGNTGSQYSHWVQFQNVLGGSISYNRFEDIAGQALHPHDGISVYKSNGKIGDSIMVVSNLMRGGQQFAWPTSGATGVGITISDVSGNYQVVRNNILVNTGYEGIIFVSSGNSVKIDHNKIYGAPMGISLTGIAIIGKSQINCGYNQVLWYKASGSVYNYWTSNSPLPIDWNKNIWNAKIDASILPAKLITWQ